MMQNYFNNPRQQMLDNLYKQKDYLDKQRDYVDGQINQYTQPQQPVQPINNYINTGVNVDMEAKILKDNETVDSVIVARRTLFVDEKNKRVVIKEVNGDISKQYEIVVPLDPKDKKIQELEEELEKLKTKIDTKVEKESGTNAKK